MDPLVTHIKKQKIFLYTHKLIEIKKIFKIMKIKKVIGIIEEAIRQMKIELIEMRQKKIKAERK